jgi:hypothetical protein
MTFWPDIGPYAGPTPNRNVGAMVEHRGLVLHIASGSMTARSRGSTTRAPT